MHDLLTVREALRYTVALRRPDLDSVDSEHIDEVIAELNLTERADAQLADLSRGERKRAEVAVELIVDPAMLLLDEPGTGLDPGLNRRLMRTLRSIADRGRGVCLITHETGSLGLCDRVVVMAPGGSIAFDGPPAEAPQHFAVGDLDAIYERARAGARGARGRDLRGEPARAGAARARSAVRAPGADPRQPGSEAPLPLIPDPGSDAGSGPVHRAPDRIGPADRRALEPRPRRLQRRADLLHAADRRDLHGRQRDRSHDRRRAQRARARDRRRGQDRRLHRRQGARRLPAGHRPDGRAVRGDGRAAAAERGAAGLHAGPGAGGPDGSRGRRDGARGLGARAHALAGGRFGAAAADPAAPLRRRHRPGRGDAADRRI